jgi:flagellar hook assembly protein FlgD
VQLEIYDILGQKVSTLLTNRKMNRGFHSVMWLGKDSHGRDVASGMYIYILQSGNDIRTKKLILLR